MSKDAYSRNPGIGNNQYCFRIHLNDSCCNQKVWHPIWHCEGFEIYLEPCQTDTVITDRKLYASMAALRKSVIRNDNWHRGLVLRHQNGFMKRVTPSCQNGAWILNRLRLVMGEKFILFFHGNSGVLISLVKR